MKRIGALAWRIFLQFLRDRRTLVLIFVVPIVIMGLLTWVLRAESEPFRITLLAENQESEMVKSLLGNLLLKNANVEMVGGLTREEFTDALKDGRIQGAIIIRGAGMKELEQGRRAGIEVMLEGSDPMSAREFFQDLQRVQQPLLNAIQGMIYLSDEDLSMILPPEIDVEFIYGGEEFNETDYLAPPVIAFLAFFFVFFLTAVSFLRERNQGTMERLMASPLTRFEIISGYLIGFMGFALAQTSVIIIFVIFILKIHYLGSLASILLVELILIIGASNMGMLFSSFAKNEFQVAQFIPLVILPQVLLSGVLWSVESMPKVLQYISYALPLTWANQTLRNLMIKGFSLWQVMPGLMILVAFAAAMVAASIISMRRSLY